MPIKFLLLGGVLGFFRRGGWKCQFYFYGRGDFSDSKTFAHVCGDPLSRNTCRSRFPQNLGVFQV